MSVFATDDSIDLQTPKNNIFMFIYILILLICIVLMIDNFLKIIGKFNNEIIHLEKNIPSKHPPQYIREPSYDPLDINANLYSSIYNRKLFYKLSYIIIDKMPQKILTEIDILLTKFYGKEFFVYFFIFVLVKISIIITFLVLNLYFSIKIVPSCYVLLFFFSQILLKMLYFISILHKIWFMNYYSTLFNFKSEYTIDACGKEHETLFVFLKDLSKPEFSIDLINQRQYDIENNEADLNEVVNTWVHCQSLYKSHNKIKTFAEKYDPIINFVCCFSLSFALLVFILI